MTQVLVKSLLAIAAQQIVEWSAVLLLPVSWALGAKVMSMMLLVLVLYWFHWLSQSSTPNAFSLMDSARWIGFGVWCMTLGLVCVLGASLALLIPGVVLLLFFAMLPLSYWDHECRFFFAFHDVLKLGKLGFVGLLSRVALPILVFGVARQTVLPVHAAPWVHPGVYLVNLTAEMALLLVVVAGASRIYVHLRSRLPLPEWLTPKALEASAQNKS
jgi:hypothetical protein